MLVYYIVLKV